MSRVLHFVDNRLTDGGDIFTLTSRSRFTHQKDFLILDSIRDRVNPMDILRLEGLGKLEKKKKKKSNFS
jgi:hypothetical protein